MSSANKLGLQSDKVRIIPWMADQGAGPSLRPCAVRSYSFRAYQHIWLAAGRAECHLWMDASFGVWIVDLQKNFTLRAYLLGSSLRKRKGFSRP
jgi:hypothetical protein